MKTRLQRYLADCGVASRRQCEAMILAGRVSVNGVVRRDMPVLIDTEHDVITVDEEKIGAPAQALHEEKKVYLLLNKPKGILVTNNDPSQRKTVNELLIGIKERLFPVGRLDMDSRGALIMTNDGELANRLTHPRYGIEKTYIVEVDGRLGHDDLEKMKRGVWLGPRSGPGGMRSAPGSGAGRPASGDHPSFRSQGRKTEPFRVKIVGRERGRTLLEVHVAEAKNSEIRRVMARLGHIVRDLNRVSIAGKITLKGLEVGKFRPLSASEIKYLFHATTPEFHSQKQSATQAWYEQKEMEKERKRLRQDASQSEAPHRAPREIPQGAPHGNAGPSAAATPSAPGARTQNQKEKIERKLRPERRGKKPFIPPTGRNAGKPLGGNYLGKQRLERDRAQQDSEIPPHEDAPTIHAEIRAIHPLGEAAMPDE